MQWIPCIRRTMGLYDRDYTQAEDSRRPDYGLPQFRFGLPSLTRTVKWLLISNVAVFIAGVLVHSLGDFLERWFAVDARTWVTAIEPWRLVTYEFLHARNVPEHILFNMVGLFFLGPALEQQWGGRRFLLFYLICGACGAFLYILMAGTGLLPAGTLIGASGSVLAVLAACAILFPHATVVIYIFPVPIRLAAVGMVVVYVLSIITGTWNAGGNAAHLGGMAAGAAYVLLMPRWEYLSVRWRTRLSQRSLESRRNLQIDVDHILAKVHQSGLHSLTTREKRTLKKASREENRRQRR